MKGLKLIVCILIMLGGSMSINAQDARFSQFYTAASHTNPALTGVFPGQFRIAVNYRNQWSSFLSGASFNTIGASFDYRVKTNKYDYLSGGLSLLRDDAGDARFNQTKVNLALSYLKKIGGSSRYSTSEHYIAIGFQGGVGQNGIDWSRLSFSEQFNNEDEVFVETDPTGENFGNRSKLYTDLNAGLAWYAVFDDDLSLYAGFAMHHLTNPDISFYDGSDDVLYSKYVAQIGGQIPFTDNLSILPAAIFTLQGPSNETVAGTNFRYSNNDRNELALRIGGWARVVADEESPMVLESFIVSSMIEINRFLIGLSYDINLSSLRPASNSRGAFELSMTYIHEEKSRYNASCPKF
jgi:type IX secretion system PorP/SprF family membrane protein